MDVHVADRRVHHQRACRPRARRARRRTRARARAAPRAATQARARGARTPVIARRAHASRRERLADAHGAAAGRARAASCRCRGGSSRMTVEPMLKRPISAPLASARGARRAIERQVAAPPRLRGVTSPCQTVDMLPTNSAPTSTRAKLSGAGLEHADHALVTREQPRHGRRGDGVDAEQLPGHVPRRAQRARQRHVDAVVVEGREVERREGAATESSRPSGASSSSSASSV